MLIIERRKKGRLLLRFLLAALLLIILLPLIAVSGHPKSTLPLAAMAGGNCEVRGVWLNPPAFNTPTTRAETLAKINAGHINTVFMLAPPIAEFKGWSDPDAFSAMIADLKDVGVSVHIWVANLYRVVGTSADFRDPAEQAAQVAWADALLSAYPQVDGYHLDYIRSENLMPVNESGWLDGVSATVSAIADHMAQNYPKYHLTAAVWRVSPESADFTTEDIPQWFLDWYNANPGNPYDHPDYLGTTSVPVNMKVQQDPVSWMRDTAITGVIPMEYCTNDNWWQAEVDHWRLFMDDQGQDMNQIFMGVGWLDTQWSDYDPPAVVRKIKYGRTQGVGGFVIFELGYSEADDWPLMNALTIDSTENEYDAPYETWVSSCLIKVHPTFLPLVTAD